MKHNNLLMGKRRTKAKSRRVTLVNKGYGVGWPFKWRMRNPSVPLKDEGTLES